MHAHTQVLQIQHIYSQYSVLDQEASNQWIPGEVTMAVVADNRTFPNINNHFHLIKHHTTQWLQLFNIKKENLRTWQIVCPLVKLSLKIKKI